MGILAWLALGLIAGALAKLIYPGHQGGGIIANNWLRHFRCINRWLYWR